MVSFIIILYAIARHQLSYIEGSNILLNFDTKSTLMRTPVDTTAISRGRLIARSGHCEILYI